MKMNYLLLALSIVAAGGLLKKLNADSAEALASQAGAPFGEKGTGAALDAGKQAWLPTVPPSDSLQKNTKQTQPINSNAYAPKMKHPPSPNKPSCAPSFFLDGSQIAHDGNSGGGGGFAFTLIVVAIILGITLPLVL